MASRRGHLILLPFMAQGHIIPFMALARVLEQRTDHAITFVNTPLNVHAARAAFPSTTRTRFAELPFNSSDHGLPPNSENADALSYSLILNLLEASTTLRPAFENLVSDIFAADGSAPLSIISDFFFGWTVDVAKSFGIFHSVFLPSNAYGYGIYLSLWLHLPHTNTSSDEFSVPDFQQPITIHRSQLSNHLNAADGTDRWSLFLQPQLLSCLRSDAFLLNTVRELDEVGLGYFEEKMGNRKVWAIGPVAAVLKTPIHSSKVPAIKAEACNEWLSQHRQSSVLYISFGSMNTISASQMMELAIGLEESGKPFIWFYNSKMLQEIMGVSVEIARTNRSEIDRGHVAAVIETVMGDTEKGVDMRRSVGRVKEILEAAVREEEGFRGSSLEAVDRFVDAALSTRTTVDCNGK
ncbi:hypothetical protein H6P81_013806 [Aristolochia fimbriata]|uniref:Uncharacterized protein n=1 Tax=Aristolochia fimbriata TaxID=158543 RepID=A0AAV7EKD8_ARIFI|nr:hypothetical protein H6P81_013806 [Aristolochia fimbriata]